MLAGGKWVNSVQGESAVCYNIDCRQVTAGHVPIWNPIAVAGSVALGARIG